MNKTLLIIGLCLSFFSCKAQNTLVSLKTSSKIYNLPDHGYLIDVNHLLDKYEGTWTGNNQGKNFTFYIEKVTQNPTIRPISYDVLLMRYKITDYSGNVILDTSLLPDDAPLVINGNCFDSNGTSYLLDYVGEDAGCGQAGNIFIEVPSSTPNQMKLFLAPDRDMIDTSLCPNGVHQILPTDKITLTKQ